MRTYAQMELSVQINHQPDATIFQFIILTFIYSSTCFGRFPAHHQELDDGRFPSHHQEHDDCSGSRWFYLRIVVIAVLCSWSGRPFSRPSSGARWLQWQPLVLPSYRGDSRAVFVVGPTTNTAQLSPRYEDKTRGCHCSRRAPDDGRENARNMLSCK